MQTFTGREYLKIDIANNFGLDKKTWAERLAWFDQHEASLPEMLNQAAEPALFYAGLEAYKAVQRGEPIGYPISLDATSSGMQILACLTGDRKAAELCNVVAYPKPSKLGLLEFGEQAEIERRDGYTVIYEHMLSQIGESGKIKRDDTKKAIMTSLYGSKAVPKDIFGEGELLRVFLDTMEELAPAAWELNQFFLDIWDSKALSHEWVMPDNFHVVIKVMSQVSKTVHLFNEPIEIFRKVNAPTKEGRSLGANTTHSIDGMIVREMSRRCNYDAGWIKLIRDLLDGVSSHEIQGKENQMERNRMVAVLWDHYKASGYLSARILQYIDAVSIKQVEIELIRELVDSLPAKPFKVLAVHDCFRCLPQYGNDLRKQYIRQLHEIARSNLLSFLLSQIMRRQVSVGKDDPTLANDILNTEYALS